MDLRVLGPSERAVERLRQRLMSEGAFSRRLPIPENVVRIAVISNERSEGLKDFVSIVGARPGVQVDVVNVNLLARTEIAEAIRKTTAEGAPYELSVALRGGGLQGVDFAVWASEAVAQAYMVGGRG